MPGIIQNIPDVPTNIDQGLYLCLVGMRNALLQSVQPTVIPPVAPTNLVVTPGPGSNIVQFTRSNGEGYAVYANSTPSLNGATRFDIGKSNSFTHNVGVAGVLQYYSVVALLGQLQSTRLGPISGTTAALNASITLPTNPPVSQTPTRSNETGAVVPGAPSANQYQVDL